MKDHWTTARLNGELRLLSPADPFANGKVGVRVAAIGACRSDGMVKVETSSGLKFWTNGNVLTPAPL